MTPIDIILLVGIVAFTIGLIKLIDSKEEQGMTEEEKNKYKHCQVEYFPSIDKYAIKYKEKYLVCLIDSYYLEDEPSENSLFTERDDALPRLDKYLENLKIEECIKYKGYVSYTGPANYTGPRNYTGPDEIK
jgi:hypothetical protein